MKTDEEYVVCIFVLNTSTPIVERKIKTYAECGELLRLWSKDCEIVYNLSNVLKYTIAKD